MRKLSKAYGGVQAVHEVSFSVDAGEVVAMIGPNGAGKTTCFNMLNGQLAPDAGEIRLDEKSLVGLAPHRIWRLGVGRTFQITATFGSMSVRENVQTALLSHRRQLASILSSAPTATSSASSSRWRSPTGRGCSSWTSRPPAWRRRSAAR